jgi:hypothetical protein
MPEAAFSQMIPSYAAVSSSYASASDSWLSSMFNAKQRPRRFLNGLRRSLADLGIVLNFRLGV